MTNYIKIKNSLNVEFYINKESISHIINDGGNLTIYNIENKIIFSEKYETKEEANSIIDKILYEN